MIARTMNGGVMTAGLLALVVWSCSAERIDTSALSGELHACELASAGDVSRIFAKDVADASPSMENVNGAAAFSQCTYRFAGGGMGLSVQIRRSGAKIGTSRQDDIAAARRQQDSLSIGEDVATAIEAGTDINGLGSVAYEFDDQGRYRQLVVYFLDHYQLSLLSFGDGENSMADARRSLAQHIIDRLSD